MLLGLYSAKASRYGTHIYSTPEGGEIEVTAATRRPEQYVWDDVENRGEVVAYLRPGSVPTDKFFIRDTDLPAVVSAHA